MKGILTPRYVRKDGSRTYNWGEVSQKISGPRLDICDLGNDDGHLTLIVGLVFVTFYFKIPIHHNWETFEHGIGFYFSDDALVLEWLKKRKFFHYPWSLDFYKRWEKVEKLCFVFRGEDSSAFIEMPRSANHGSLATKHVYPYTYVLKSGEIQNRKATVYADRMEWRRRWLPFSTLFNLVRDSINVSFDDEVGEETGSWKGGCTGCGYELNPGESAEQCLRRMELERKFK